jgi:hypothetical protein
VLEFLVAMLLIKRAWPKIRFRLVAFEKKQVREILGFSIFAMLLNVGSQLSFQSDQLVINAFSTPDDGLYFDVGNKPFPILLQLVLGIGMVMMPTATRLQATHEMSALRTEFLKWSKVAYSIALLVGIYLLVLAPEFDAMWMGPSFAMSSGRVTRALMLAYIFFIPVRGVASPMLMGLGKVALPATAMLGMGIVNVATSLLLVQPMGIYGVAIGTAIPCVVFAIAMAVVACRAVRVPLREYIGYVMIKPSLGVLPPIALLWIIKRPLEFFNINAPRAVELPRLIVSGFAMVGLFATVWIAFVYRNDPYLDVAARVRRVLFGGASRTLKLVMSGIALVACGTLAGVILYTPPSVAIPVSIGAACVPIAVMIVELVARKIIRRYGGYYRYTPYWREEHEWTTPMPGFTQKSVVEINRDGERGDPPPLPGERCYRILVVGGSAAECYYLDQSETWSAVVQRTLNQPEHLARLGALRVHVGNVARAIIPVMQMNAMLAKILPRYRSLDAVLVMVGGADVVAWVERGTPPKIDPPEYALDRLFEQHPERAWGWRPPQTALWRVLSKLNRRIRRPLVLDPSSTQWLARVRKMRAEATELVDTMPDPTPMLDHFEKHLRALLETARSRTKRVILVRQPWFGPNPTPEEEAMFWNYGLGRPYRETVTKYFTPRIVDALMRAMDERASLVAKSMGIEQVDVGSQIEHSAKTFYDELHFAPAGAEAAGHIIAAAVVRVPAAKSEEPESVREDAAQAVA